MKLINFFDYILGVDTVDIRILKKYHIVECNNANIGISEYVKKWI